MTVYNESPNKATASISFAVFVDDSSDASVKRFYELRQRDERDGGHVWKGTMSSYIGDGDRLGGFNQLEHGTFARLYAPDQGGL